MSNSSAVKTGKIMVSLSMIAFTYDSTALGQLNRETYHIISFMITLVSNISFTSKPNKIKVSR